MGRTRLALSLLLVACPLAAVADGRKKNDKDALRGKWEIVSITVNGRQVPAKDVKGLRLEIKGDKYLVTHGGKTASRTFKLDEAARPRAMDITYDDGPNKGKTNRAIYALDGDTLKICRHEHPEKERPKTFAAGAGSGRALVTWKRVK